MTAHARFNVLFALLYGSMGISGFFALYLKSRGFSGINIGVLIGVLPIVSVFIGPVWAYIADRTQNIRTLLVIAFLGMAISILVTSQSRGFSGLLSCMLVHAVFHAPVAPFCHSMALTFLDNTSGPRDFGTMRMWGSIGFALSVFLVGALVIEYWINGLLYLHAAAITSMAVIAVTLPEPRLPRLPRFTGWPIDAYVLRLSPKLWTLLIGMILIGATLGVVNQYMIIYLDELQMPGWLSGGMLAAGALFEVPLMARTTTLVQRFGARFILLMGVGLLPIRWCLYIYINTPLLLLPLQLTHSIAMFSLLVVGVLFVDTLLPPQWRTTGQTMYALALHGLGSGLGTFAAGLIYNYYGMSAVWAMCLLIGGIGFIVLLVATQTEKSPVRSTGLP